MEMLFNAFLLIRKRGPMSFPLFVEDLNSEDQERIYNDTLIEPRVESDIPKSVMANLPAAAAGMLNKTAEAFSFLKIDDAGSTTKQIRLPFFYARETLGEESVPGEGCWKPFCDERLKTPTITLRPYQTGVIDTAMGHLNTIGTTTIVLPPGAGKTILGVYLASLLGLKTAYIYPSKLSSLKGQWSTSHEKVFPEIEKIVKDNILFPPEPAKAPKHKYKNIDTFNFILTSDLRVASITDDMVSQIGTVVIDEGHMLCTKSRVDPLLRFSPKYIIVLSATPVRPDGNHRMLHLLAGPHGIFEKSKTSFKLYRNKVDIFTPERLSKAGVTDYAAFCNGLADSEEYNNAILNAVVSNPHRKIIILTKLVSHVERLTDLFRKNGIECDTMFGKKQTHSDTSVLIGTTHKISTGYDVATTVVDFNGVAADTLILTHGVKRWQNFEQSKGRVMRAGSNNEPAIIWMCTRNKILCRHLSGLKKYIGETGGTIFNMPENNLIK